MHFSSATFVPYSWRLRHDKKHRRILKRGGHGCQHILSCLILTISNFHEMRCCSQLAMLLRQICQKNCEKFHFFILPTLMRKAMKCCELLETINGQHERTKMHYFATDTSFEVQHSYQFCGKSLISFWREKWQNSFVLLARKIVESRQKAVEFKTICIKKWKGMPEDYIFAFKSFYSF